MLYFPSKYNIAKSFDLLLTLYLYQILFKPGYFAGSSSILHGKESFLTHQRAVPLLPKVRWLPLIVSLLALNHNWTWRYKIRGIRNILFYGLPDHARFYTEFLSFPFLDEGVEPSDVTCRVLYCRYDWMRLERIAGTERALELLRQV